MAARARHAVQANAGTISPAETLNFVDGFGTAAAVDVTAGVATVTLGADRAKTVCVVEDLLTAAPLTAQGHYYRSPRVTGLRRLMPTQVTSAPDPPLQTILE